MYRCGVLYIAITRKDYDTEFAIAIDDDTLLLIIGLVYMIYNAIRRDCP